MFIHCPEINLLSKKPTMDSSFASATTYFLLLSNIKINGLIKTLQAKINL